jgi:hypothetical protein
VLWSLASRQSTGSYSTRFFPGFRSPPPPPLHSNTHRFWLFYSRLPLHFRSPNFTTQDLARHTHASSHPPTDPRLISPHHTVPRRPLTVTVHTDATTRLLSTHRMLLCSVSVSVPLSRLPCYVLGLCYFPLSYLACATVPLNQPPTVLLGLCYPFHCIRSIVSVPLYPFYLVCATSFPLDIVQLARLRLCSQTAPGRMLAAI